jgi:hypothetical protein
MRKFKDSLVHKLKSDVRHLIYEVILVRGKKGACRALELIRNEHVNN